MYQNVFAKMQDVSRGTLLIATFHVEQSQSCRHMLEHLQAKLCAPNPELESELRQFHPFAVGNGLSILLSEPKYGSCRLTLVLHATILAIHRDVQAPER